MYPIEMRNRAVQLNRERERFGASRIKKVLAKEFPGEKLPTSFTIRAWLYDSHAITHEASKLQYKPSIDNSIEDTSDMDLGITDCFDLQPAQQHIATLEGLQKDVIKLKQANEKLWARLESLSQGNAEEEPELQVIGW